MPTPSSNSSSAERLAALRLLRENMYYSNPELYMTTDIAEDFPGPLKIPGDLLKDVLPSLAVIEQDPEKRKLQINEAIKRIKSARKSKENLGKEIKENVINMGVKSLPLSIAISGAFNLLGPRKPWARNQAGKLALRSPFNLKENAKRLFTDKQYLKDLALDSLSEGAQGSATAAAIGAAYPIIANKMNISNKALRDAAEIMQEDPYVTALPGADLVASLNSKQQESALKRSLYGAGGGAVAGASSAILPSAIKATGLGLLKLYNKARGTPDNINIAEALKSKLRKDIPIGAGLGASLGGVGGALVKPDEPNDQS